MLKIVFYFQVHQPFRLKPYRVLDIGADPDYFDENLNSQVMKKVAEKCYLPTNKLLLELIDKYEGQFRVAFSITGTAIEQFRLYAPEVLDSFRLLAQSGCVEFLGETYYHSLSFARPDYDDIRREEFIEQVRMHRKLMESEFGFSPMVFRNTELIYHDKLSDVIWEEEGFKAVLAEGVERILGWRSPLYAYKSYNHKLFLLLKFYSLADDIAFRFSNKGWVEYPLTVEKFVEWVSRLPLIEKENKNLFLNLFMDYETFGEHQWEDSGIFNFLRRLPGEIFKRPFLSFGWPSDVVDDVNYEPEVLSFPEPVSWADTERDLSAWLENEMQTNAADSFYGILGKIKEKGRSDLLEPARRLSTSDHFYYMCTKYFQDGDVHKYFSPYDSPEQAYLHYLNALADLEERLR